MYLFSSIRIGFLADGLLYLTNSENQENKIQRIYSTQSLVITPGLIADIVVHDCVLTPCIPWQTDGKTIGRIVSVFLDFQNFLSTLTEYLHTRGRAKLIFGLVANTIDVRNREWITTKRTIRQLDATRKNRYNINVFISLRLSYTVSS